MPRPSAAIGACVFDAYGTMFDVHSAVAACRGEIGAQADRLSDAWRQRQLQYTWLRSMMGVYADFWTITGDALDVSMRAVGIDDRALRDKLMQLYLTLKAYDDVGPTLARLRQAGLRTAILSNGNRRMLDAAVASAGLGEKLDAVLSVDEVGIYKPDKSVYQLAVDRLDLPAGRICFLSSNAWDAHAAAHFGFHVYWCNRTQQPREALPGALAGEIGSLAELPALLEGVSS